MTAPLTFFVFAYWHDPRWRGFVGAGVKIRDMARNLAEMGHKVTLFLPKYGFAKKNLPFAVIEIPLLNVPGLRSISYNVFLFCYLVFHWRSLRPDVVYLRRTSLIVPLLYAGMKKAKFYLEINDDPFAGRREEGSRVKFRLRSVPAQMLDRINIRLADRCFAISGSVIEKIGRRMPAVPSGKMIIMPSGANTELMQPWVTEKARRTVGLDGNLRYVGFVGTLLSHQGLEYLIEAAPSIIRAVPTARFLIIGDGPMKQAWGEQAGAMGLEHFFTFTGEIAYEGLPPWINAMDVCVAPYHRDAGLRSPVKVFDYLACGKPVVASEVEGTTGLFRNAPLVTLVRPDSAPALAAAVVDVLSRHDGPVMKERTAAHQWVRERFDRRQMAGLVAGEALKQTGGQAP